MKRLSAAQIQTRVEALAELAQGATQVEVAEKYGVTTRTIRNWLADYRRGRTPSPGALQEALRLAFEAEDSAKARLGIYRVMAATALSRSRQLEREFRGLGPY